MALKALICPQCGSPLQVEEESEFGECKHCNTTIKIQDIYKVYHKVDNREATDSRRIMGQRCFEVGRYIQAEHYYTQVLEVYPHDIEGMYRKGICSLMNSIGKSTDTAEYKLYMKEARATIDSLEDIEDRNKWYAQIDADNKHCVEAILTTLSSHVNKYDTEEECLDRVNDYISALIYSDAITDYIADKKIAFETYSAIKNYISYTNIYDLKYKNDTYVAYKLENKDAYTIKEYINRFVNKYNNSPYRIKRVEDLTYEKDSLDKTIDLMRQHAKDLRNGKRNRKRAFPLKNGKNWLITLILWAPTIITVIAVIVLLILGVLAALLGGVVLLNIISTIAAIDILLIPVALIVSIIGTIILWGIALILYVNSKDDGKENVIDMDPSTLEGHQAINNKVEDILEYKARVKDVEGEISQMGPWMMD